MNRELYDYETTLALLLLTVLGLVLLLVFLGYVKLCEADRRLVESNRLWAEYLEIERQRETGND